MPRTTPLPGPGSTETVPSARRQATRQRLLDAASDVFAERGFHGASVEDICERAGFTRGAFYSNFSSKDDLVIELSTRQMAQVVERITRAAASPAPAEQVLRDVLAALTDEPRRHEQWLLLTTEFTLHAIRDTRARKAWGAQQRRIREALIDVVEAVCGTHGVTIPVPTETFVRAAMALVVGSMTQRLIEPSSLHPGELERTVLPVVLALETGSAG